MDKLFTSIMAQYNGTSGATLRSLTTGGMHLILAPYSVNSQSAPFIVISCPSNAPEATMSSQHEIFDVQFSIFVDDYKLADGLDIATELFSVYDDYMPTFTAGRVFNVKRVNSGMVMKDPDKGYHIAVQYRYWFCTV